MPDSCRVPITRIPLLIVIALIAVVPAGASAAHGASQASHAKATPAKDPAAAVLAKASALATEWARCATSRPAHRLLSIANRTRATRPRVQRARAALRAWRLVVADCSKPVDQPQVIVGDVAYLPPPA
jgi:flagellar basal body-associated protein FliL